jgi:NAD-dependent DNA ligase
MFLPAPPSPIADTIFMTWDSDPTEYLCVVHNSEDKKNALVVASADAKFTETLDFDPASDMWRFSEGNVKTISDKARSKGKAKVAANPNIVKAVASKTGEERSEAIRSGPFCVSSLLDLARHALPPHPPASSPFHHARCFSLVVVSESAKASKSLDGLRFVITGITQEQGTEFGDYCTAIILSCGGRVTGGVSGATDYLVAGDIHYNPFLKTTGPIEGGSKYKKAITSDRCKIIGLEDLMELANGEDV